MSDEALLNLSDRELFHEFEPSEIGQLGQLMKITDHPDETVILEADQKPGETERALHILLQGEISVTTKPTAANNVPVARVMKPGEIFGLITFVSGDRHTATCTAKGETRIASLPRRSLDALANGREALAVKVHRVICNQLARDLRLCDRRLTNALHKGLKWEDLPTFVSR